MSLKRSFLAVFLAGGWCLLTRAAYDRDWPNYSATGWLLLIGGWVVIALVAFGVDSWLSSRKTTPETIDTETP